MSPPVTSIDGGNDIKKQIKIPLHIAARKGYLDCLKILISVGKVDVFRKSEHGITALHLAAANGSIRVVEELLKSGPGLKHLKDESKRTALFFAMKHVKVVEILINSGAKVNIKDKHNRTPISYAAEKGLLECTNKLIENEADINFEDKEKMRPIHYAAEKGHSEVFRVLLDKTDQAEFENFYWNCLDLAINENQVEIAYAIFQTQDSEKWKIMLRSRSKHDDSDSKCVDTPMRKLIRKMPDVAKVVFDKCTQIKSTRNKHFTVKFNYEFLDDTYYLGGWKETTHKKRGKVAENVHDDLQENKDEEKNQKTSK
ncbi:transient receptor potential cation channel subfamily A member 1 homolog, partial [Ruditapes philippinarum]|uniref:transient receptor potential cation channel subfamily A member 1 homolog n=1 Tax=Ruditapes philippinarum TaxID=129788 RepID=UPI00295B5224